MVNSFLYSCGELGTEHLSGYLCQVSLIKKSFADTTNVAVENPYIVALMDNKKYRLSLEISFLHKDITFADLVVALSVDIDHVGANLVKASRVIIYKNRDCQSFIPLAVIVPKNRDC